MRARIVVSLIISFTLVTLSVFVPLLWIFALPQPFYNPPLINIRAYLIDILVWGSVTLLSVGIFGWGITWIKRLVLAAILTVPLTLLMIFIFKEINPLALTAVSFLGAFFLSTAFIQPKNIL